VLFGGLESFHGSGVLSVIGSEAPALLFLAAQATRLDARDNSLESCHEKPCSEVLLACDARHSAQSARSRSGSPRRRHTSPAATAGAAFA
jgi:hypothetical protein